MRVYIEPEKALWSEIIARPAMDTLAVMEKVKPILEAVKARGDEALAEFALKFDGFSPSIISEAAPQVPPSIPEEAAPQVSPSISSGPEPNKPSPMHTPNLENAWKTTPQEIQASETELPESLKQAIQTAAKNIETFHRAQLKNEEPVSTMPGVTCWRKWVGIEKVGLYIPGGTAPLFSTLLMLAIPARIAGCKQVVLCTPPSKDGTIHPAIRYAAKVAGVTDIFKVGGAQAIAAMAYGTESIPQVYKIFGPGNQYVTAAKQWVQMDGIAIDMPAGPSEVCVWCDDSANPSYVAADLLSQAEHGVDSQVLFVAKDIDFVERVKTALEAQLALLPRKDFATAALENSWAVVLNDDAAALELVNAYAAEHLIISTADAAVKAELITNAGSIFIGHYSPESVGDYASGTNHTLPTNGFTRAYSGVSIDSFVKKITVQQLTKQGLKQIAQTVVQMAEAEGLQAHARAVTIRLENN